MTKNALRSALLVITALLSVGCNRAKDENAHKYQGIIELDESLIGFEVAGRIKEISVRRGSPVVPGQVLAILDDGLERPLRDARAAELAIAEAQVALLRAGARRTDVASAAAELRAANASLELLQHNLARVRPLASRGAIPSAQVDDLQDQVTRAAAQRDAVADRARTVRSGARPEELAAALARVDAARAALASVDARLARFTLHAPTAGTVLDVNLDPGEMVAPGTPIITLGNVEHPYADVFVPQGALSALHVNRRAQANVDGDRSVYPGQIESIERRTEFTPRYLFSPEERPNLVVRVRVRLDDPQLRLHAGVPVFVRITP
ncbi:MAG: HlyD family efflux transporter periplasmic adaptor subunit [Sandaracinaceae bacterium]|jgi:HlyD family secretion protein|nr:HlyD family efflux transporter periplasmic adaptor subunit [Sandaracinaceae bacterium]